MPLRCVNQAYAIAATTKVGRSADMMATNFSAPHEQTVLADASGVLVLSWVLPPPYQLLPCHLRLPMLHSHRGQWCNSTRPIVQAVPLCGVDQQWQQKAWVFSSLRFLGTRRPPASSQMGGAVER